MTNFAIGIAAVALTELGRGFYRPYIRAEGINDFHVADTLGNSFGTIAAIFVFIAFLSREPKDDLRFVVIGAIGTFVFELAQPLLGKSIDPWTFWRRWWLAWPRPRCYPCSTAVPLGSRPHTHDNAHLARSRRPPLGPLPRPIGEGGCHLYSGVLNRG